MSGPTRLDSDLDLPRKFGFWTGLFVVAASMVGVGILTTSGYTLRDTGSAAALLGLWAVGGLLALAGALSMAELATTFPKVGGEYVFVREAFGPPIAFLYGWSTILLGFAGPIALVAHAAAVYCLAPVKEAWPAPFESALAAWYPPAIATIWIAVFTIAHCLGQRESAWVQGFTTTFKLLTLGGMALAGFFFGTGDWNNLVAGAPLATQQPGVLATSLVYVMYSYTGWNGAVYLAGEVRDPSRNLPRCLLAGCLLVTGLYLLLNLAYAFALDPVSLRGESGEQIEAVADLAARRLFGPRLAGPLSGLVGLGILASLSAFILTGPRVAFAMARDGLFPRVAGQVHQGRSTPVAATFAIGVLATIILWSGSFKQLLDFTSVGLSVVAALVVASIFPIHHRPGLTRPFRVPLYPLPPALFLVVSAWMIARATWANWIPAVLSLASILASLPVYWLLKGQGRTLAPLRK